MVTHTGQMLIITQPKLPTVDQNTKQKLLEDQFPKL